MKQRERRKQGLRVTHSHQRHLGDHVGQNQGCLPPLVPAPEGGVQPRESLDDVLERAGEVATLPLPLAGGEKWEAGV